MCVWMTCGSVGGHYPCRQPLTPHPGARSLPSRGSGPSAISPTPASTQPALHHSPASQCGATQAAAVVQGESKLIMDVGTSMSVCGVLALMLAPAQTSPPHTHAFVDQDTTGRTASGQESKPRASPHLSWWLWLLPSLSSCWWCLVFLEYC